MKVATAKSGWIVEAGDRFDASYHLSDGRQSKLIIEVSPFQVTTIGSVTDDIYYGGRAKRIYIKKEDYGVPFMGSSDMLKSDFSGLKFISRKYTPNLASYYVEKGWTLISRSGTIGNTAYTNDDFTGKALSEHIIRVIPKKDKIKEGFLYAYLSSKHGYALLTQGTFGAVIQHIEPHHIVNLPIPIFPEDQQQRIHDLIVQAGELRVEANILLREAQEKLMTYANLPALTNEDYEYFGPRSHEREISIYKIRRSQISSLTINAFNYSRKIEKVKDWIKSSSSVLKLEECITSTGFFTTGSFKRLELNSPKSIQLINQSDIFNVRKVGKSIARLHVKTENLVKYGEILIAGVGTLGENETFCRCIFANEELEGQLISGEFLRMNSNEKIPSGYLFSFLSSPYGFRLIRSTHTGTKLCRPIRELLKEIPVPVINEEEMYDIDKKVRIAHTKRFEAMNLENKAINLIETEIASWQS